MRTVLSLLDEARDLCGNDAKLAKTLGVSLHHPNEWRNGKRTITPTTVGFLCNVVGIEGPEAVRLATDAVIASAKPEKQGVLRRVFLHSLGTGATCGAVLMMLTAECVMNGARMMTAGISATMYRTSTAHNSGIVNRC